LSKANEPLPLNPVDRKGSELRRKKLEAKLEARDLGLTRERLQMAAVVVSVAFVGELLHGFRDLTLKLLFSSYFAR
jgi:hypothetical protein